MKLPTPKSVTIGSQVFDIVERSRSEDGMLNDATYGYTLDMENLIVIDSGLKPSRKKVTLLHEILHATRFVYDTSVKPTKKDDFDTWEHYFIGIWEESVLVLLKQNPDLVAYLLE